MAFAVANTGGGFVVLTAAQNETGTVAAFAASTNSRIRIDGWSCSVSGSATAATITLQVGSGELARSVFPTAGATWSVALDTSVIVPVNTAFNVVLAGNGVGGSVSITILGSYI